MYSRMSVYVCTSVHAHLYIRIFTCCRCNSWPMAKTAWRVRIMFSPTTFLPPMRTGVACRAIDASDATPSQQSGVRQCAWRHQGRGLRVALGQCSGSLPTSVGSMHLFGQTHHSVPLSSASIQTRALSKLALPATGRVGQGVFGTGRSMWCKG